MNEHAWFFICMTILIIVFAGEPDIHDKVLEMLSAPITEPSREGN